MVGRSPLGQIFSGGGGMNRFSAGGGELSPSPPVWKTLANMEIYHGTSDRKQLSQHPLHYFIPKFYYCKAFSLQIHGKNKIWRFKTFFKEMTEFQNSIQDQVSVWNYVFCGLLQPLLFVDMFLGTLDQIFSWD